VWWGYSAHALDLRAVGCVGSGHGSRLFDDTLELVDDLRCDLVPQQTTSVDLGGGVTLVLFAHGGKALGEVAAVGWLGARGEWVVEVVACEAIPLASEVQRCHAVVLVGSNGEQLLVLLFLRRSSEMGVHLIEVRARDAGEFRAGHGGLGPGHTGRCRFKTSDVVGNDALLAQSSRYTSVLEDAVEHGGRGGADLVGHTRNGRSCVAGLACDKSTAKQKHKQETRSDGLVLLLGARDERHFLILLGSGLVVRSEVVDEDVVVPVAVAHVEVIHLGGEVGEGSAGCDRHTVASSIFKALGKDRHLLAKLAGLHSVSAYELLFVELQLADHVVHLHGLAMPVLLLDDERIILNAHRSEVVLHLAHLLHPLLLLVFELFSVLLLSLPGVKPVVTLADEQGEHGPKCRWDQTRNAEPKAKGEYVRGLPVAEESFLLLELLEVVIVGAALDEVVDVEQVAFDRDVEAGVLLPDATVTTGGEGAGRRVGPHTLGSGPCVHLLLVEGHPVRVCVRRHGLLWGRLEDSAGPDILVHGESVVRHLLLLHEGCSSKVARTKGVQRLRSGRRPGAGVVDGP
jgi:hypothetical protein